MRTTGNPAFRNLPTSGGYGSYATFNTGSSVGYGPQAPPTAVERPMTIDDVVTKTAISLGTAIAAGVLTAYFEAYALALPALLVGLVAALVLIFRRKPSAALVLTYSAAEGVLLGAVSGLFNRIYPGIALQAILGTAGVFATMLVVYKTGAVRVTPRLTKWIIGATVGAFLLMLADLLLGLFHVNTGLRDGGPLAIGFSLLVIGIAAFNFLLDFDAADQMIRGGMPAKWAWYAAFGLMTTLVWLYLEILRLLSYLQRN